VERAKHTVNSELEEGIYSFRAADELEVYELLLNNSLSERLRLEQERISFDFVINTIEELR
jgi:hypothetical protein